jgi:signal transduction histidine kinase
MTDKAVAVAAAIRDGLYEDAHRVAAKRRQYVRECMAEAHNSLHNMASQLLREILTEEIEQLCAAGRAYDLVLSDFRGV